MMNWIQPTKEAVKTDHIRNQYVHKNRDKMSKIARGGKLQKMM